MTCSPAAAGEVRGGAGRGARSGIRAASPAVSAADVTRSLTHPAGSMPPGRSLMGSLTEQLSTARLRASLPRQRPSGRISSSDPARLLPSCSTSSDPRYPPVPPLDRGSASSNSRGEGSAEYANRPGNPPPRRQALEPPAGQSRQRLGGRLPSWPRLAETRRSDAYRRHHMGTIRYMAHRAVLGPLRCTVGRLHSLGLTLYELLVVAARLARGIRPSSA